LLKLPPPMPKLWFTDTGELLSPVAMRMPAVHPSRKFASAPKRMRSRARVRS
jgi:hypothetical protein